MGRKYTIRDQLSIHSLTFTVVNWIDVFIRDQYRDVVLSSLKYCQEHKYLQVYAYCLMTSHVHLILSVTEGRTIRCHKGSKELYIKRNPKRSWQ